MKDYLILLSVFVSVYLIYCLLDAWCRARFDKSISRLLTPPPKKDWTKEDFLGLMQQDKFRLKALYLVDTDPDDTYQYQRCWTHSVAAGNYDQFKAAYIRAVDELANWIKNNYHTGAYLAAGYSINSPDLLELCLYRKTVKQNGAT